MKLLFKNLEWSINIYNDNKDIDDIKNRTKFEKERKCYIIGCKLNATIAHIPVDTYFGYINFKSFLFMKLLF
jgi:hypothetical protein